jgi:multiple sugar transport system ATP-binding protein
VNGSAWVETANGAKLPLAGTPTTADGKTVTYGIRPEHLEFGDDGIEAEVIVVEPMGSETQVVARIGTQDIIAIFRDRRPVAPGDKIHLKPRANSAHLFDKETGKRVN